MFHLAIITLFILQLNFISIESYTCSCSCCLGSGCQITQSNLINDATQCTDTFCLATCKERYYQCNISPPYGQAIGKCLSYTTSTTTNSPIAGGPYTCQCHCCNTGSYTCTPNFVGYTNAFSCQVSTCSISCTKQYPNLCVNNQYGQTQGTCIGIPTSSAVIPTNSNRCGCSCYGASVAHNYEVITTNGCSSCYTACQSVQLPCYSYQTHYCTS